MHPPTLVLLSIKGASIVLTLCTAIASPFNCGFAIASFHQLLSHHGSWRKKRNSANKSPKPFWSGVPVTTLFITSMYPYTHITHIFIFQSVSDYFESVKKKKEKRGKNQAICSNTTHILNNMSIQYTEREILKVLCYTYKHVTIFLWLSTA
jgi:hypothetical protein